jgi:long-chain fatty acid transport protein
MKKLTLLSGFLLCFCQVFAGGILTNGNQSAQYIRMLSRNASTSVDAVYYNPAGLMKMDNGFYISLQTQSLFQTKKVESGFPLLHTPKYDGTLTAPVFPTAFAVYKKDRFALSLGFGPNSGGGSVEFAKGIPYFEKDISSLVPKLAGLSKLGKNVSDYKVDIYFKGESVYWGIQGGVSYKVNNIFSVYGGVRYLPATTKYKGHLTNIELNVNGQFKNASTFLKDEVAPILTGAANNATGAAAGVQPLIHEWCRILYACPGSGSRIH